MSDLVILGFLLMNAGIYGRVLEGLPSAAKYSQLNGTLGAILFIIGGGIVTYWLGGRL